MVHSNLPERWLSCRSLQEWHDWLAENHDRAEQAWLEIKKVNAGEKGILLADAVSEALCFGWIDGKMYSLDADSYILRFTPRKPDSLWSKTNRQRAERLLAEGRMTEAGLAAIRQAKATGHWQAAYTAKEKPAMPADLEAALQSDPVARRNFDDWSNSEQLQAVVWIGQAKRAQTRQKRILETVERARIKKGMTE